MLYRASAEHGHPEEQWIVLEVRTPREDGVVISQLKRGSIYEFKVRPFFDEFQGADSEVKVVRTLEEGEYELIFPQYTMYLYRPAVGASRIWDAYSVR